MKENRMSVARALRGFRSYRSCSILSLLLAAGLASLSLAAESPKAPTSDKVLFQTDFEQDFGRFFPTSDSNAYMPSRAKGNAHSGDYCLKASGGTWTTPLIPVTPYEFYKLDFYSRITPSPGEKPGDFPWAGHWAAYFYNKDGECLPDHYSYIDASDAWKHNTICFRAKVDAAYCSIRFHPANKNDSLFIDDVTVSKIGRPEVAQWADKFYAELPPIQYTPAPDRWQYLGKTMEKLRNGGTLRVVALGDSIANDTANSPWDTLLERIYPKAHLEVVTSVRSSTGCWFYKDNVKEYVLDHHPDLLIIAGISNCRDGKEVEGVEAIRSVIRQVREKSNPDILVMTGVVSQHVAHPTKAPGWTSKVDPKGDHYRSLLLRMADEEKVEYLDMTGIWGDSMLAAMNAGRAYESYQRDTIHANERGRAVLARILEAYFSPKPE